MKHGSFGRSQLTLVRVEHPLQRFLIATVQHGQKTSRGEMANLPPFSRSSAVLSHAIKARMREVVARDADFKVPTTATIGS